MRSILIFLLIPAWLLGQKASVQLNSPDVLQVAVYDSPPFGLQYPDSTYGGLMVELWEDIAGDLGFSYAYTLTDMNTLLSGLQQGQFDIGLGAISITPRREALVDFTQAVNPSGTGIATAARSRRNAFANYWKPILINLLELIGTLLLVLLVSGTIVWLAERRYNREHPSERNIQGLADGLWWSAVTMTTVGYGDKVPNSQIGKILGIVWIFTSIILLSLFTANASAILTTTRLSSHIQSDDQLRQVRVGAARKSSGEEYLIREHINYTPFTSIEEAIDALLNEEIDAVVSNVPVLKYLNNSRDYYQRLAISPRLLLKNNMGIALPDDSSVREPIDQLLLEKIAEPKWQKAVYRYLGED
ncbi:transporter substrate-binding domain-containing protein [Phaeodactylibacter sp.]|uniref:transporter substrate-binding domain-containing protein n=1 Tax=Phaeodactylibacter sp. TaxID=1940289 RepID=UPI0025E6DE1A|nr:transporter substrate-binding domain-containing protein [Phaeodactylibacter sp.]MCI4647887.1 transporter substrate-binding domain-containing protein [Phaeodactylibacter sp.]MCI5093116.1 transporter substrate-binding domain-containing protein [Phaeodactylibacter sp.]